MKIYRISEFVLQQAGVSMERKGCAASYAMRSVAADRAVAAGFVVRWEAGAFVVGFTGNKLQILGSKLVTLGELPQPQEQMDFLAYPAEVLINGETVHGIRMIVSHHCRDLMDVFVEKEF